jgi:isoleucyl-tRNA synthetase
VLCDLSKLIAPFAPFIAEEIFTNITFKESVHLESYPVTDSSLIDKTLENEMDSLVDLVTMGRAARNQAQIKVRQPLQAIYVPDVHLDIVARMTELIKEEINVKEVICLPQKNCLITWIAKLNLKTAGPKFGKEMKPISNYLETANIQEILESFKTKKEFAFNEFRLVEEDIFISISAKEGFVFENNGNVFVALDTKLSEELISEGHARELVNKIQFTRKENNYEIMDRIKVYYHCNETLQDVFKDFAEYISAETLTDKFVYVEKPDDTMKVWDINGLEFFMKIQK